MKILTLGDGNLSFSLALSRRLRDSSVESLNDWSVTATTFDTTEKLLEKYPESNHVLQEMASARLRDHVRVQNDVDAIHLSEAFADEVFDQIVFNFPHLGFEDLLRHQAFLSHLFESCKDVLHEFGYVHIALAESQEFGWQLKEAADKRGFVLTDKLTVNEAHWPGYDFRRHQTGKSFRQRVGSCFHYSFRLAHSMNKEHQSTIANLLRLLSDQVTMATSTTSPTVAVPDATADGTVGKATSKQQLHQEQKTKQRKMHQLVEGRFRIVTAAAEDAAEAAASPTCTAASSTLFECLTCHKRFPAEQGVRTHVYTMHVLVEQQLQQEQQRADASSATGPHADTATEPPKKRLLLRDAALAVDTGLQPPSTHATDTAACAPLLAASSSSVAVWRCLDCDRSFSNQEALLQHRLAKHVALSTALSQLPSSSSSSSSKNVSTFCYPP
eukprot:gene13535-9687_t